MMSFLSSLVIYCSLRFHILSHFDYFLVKPFKFDQVYRKTLSQTVDGALREMTLL